ncbi:glutamate racemase [Weissella diestrammenae]|uniref:Glutamate racemase n=1 Tax=Weissella diestrammenae TaxID=1162633 RepID=A0A7G9T5S7_9LACO|nr:glutamate racemase [Weissella diestrammenae]MCM0582280.1 glutamate racemase [Weissella diestrammenae]QNN75452.1 glutamate racemase [Weissella diestrammenae]
MNNRAIGYIDSGVGGLTVVKQALNQLPNEQIYYVGDTARMPYGPRPTAEVVHFTEQMAAFLVAKKIKLLVVACNTATAAALPQLQASLSIPVIGVIQPGVDAAIRATTDGEIGVIATAGTVNSMSYYDALLAQDQTANIVQLPVPEFVEIVEKHDYESEDARRAVQTKLRYFEQHQVDTLILGCTHYPLLEPFIQEAMGNSVKLINSGAEAVNLVVKTLSGKNLQHDDTVVDRQADRYFTTGAVDQFKNLGEHWLNLDNLHVEQLTITANGLAQPGKE